MDVCAKLVINAHGPRRPKNRPGTRKPRGRGCQRACARGTWAHGHGIDFEAQAKQLMSDEHTLARCIAKGREGPHQVTVGFYKCGVR